MTGTSGRAWASPLPHWSGKALLPRQLALSISCLFHSWDGKEGPTCNQLGDGSPFIHSKTLFQYNVLETTVLILLANIVV